MLRRLKMCLTDLVKNGIDKKALEAGINYQEFRYREADFGNYPKGLDVWLTDDGQLAV